MCTYVPPADTERIFLPRASLQYQQWDSGKATHLATVDIDKERRPSREYVRGRTRRLESTIGEAGGGRRTRKEHKIAGRSRALSRRGRSTCV